jgi:hypothetical protein
LLGTSFFAAHATRRWADQDRLVLALRPEPETAFQPGRAELGLRLEIQ